MWLPLPEASWCWSSALDHESRQGSKWQHSLSQGDHVWHTDVLEVSGKWEVEVGNENDICEKLGLRTRLRWKLYGSVLDDLPAEGEESLIELPENRKVGNRPIKDEAITSPSRDST
ncbi:hypothetical protein L3X38_010906 [Prunus dulcis]|uniref:Uncharacterized protein n=1 Tax=Prunus dulcis TaxID=3755 RepID=A0AAD4ZEH9_PRUDU|nr:hypothetical protein L3X38_010906 [Prunus dulcis]